MLKSVSVVYKILAILIGIAALIMLIYERTLLDDSNRFQAEGISLIISALIFGTVGVITFLSFSEGIKLLVDLEEHSRE